MATTRFGIIGCGNMGQRHARSIVESAAGTVMAVTDSDAGRADTLAHDVGARTYPDVESLLGAGEVDAVVVSTPPRIRRGVLLPVIEAGLPLFVEKPPAFDLPEARACARAIAQK